MTSEVFIGLGSNIGDRLEYLRSAVRALQELDGTRVAAVSSVVESEPWGVSEQPAFANAVIRILTTIPALQLLHAVKDIETNLGRRAHVRYGPRVIDLDILLYAHEIVAMPDLIVPHPRLAEREFVVVPLLSIAPGVTMPAGVPISLETATQGHILRVLGSIPGFENITVPLKDW